MKKAAEIEAVTSQGILAGPERLKKAKKDSLERPEGKEPHS